MQVQHVIQRPRRNRKTSRAERERSQTGTSDDLFIGASPNAHLLIGETPAAQLRSNWRVRVAGAVLPLFALALVLAVASRVPIVQQTAVREVHERFSLTFLDLTFLESNGPGGGGGGGGNRNPDPPRQAEGRGRDHATVTAPRPRTLEPVAESKDAALPRPEPDLPIQAAAMGIRDLPGVITGMPSGADPASLGSGEGTGAGSGRGSGVGSGTGSGFGEGSGGGMGGGVYRPGSGVTAPQLLHEVKPNYTPDALRLRIQGVVRMEAVVMPDGSVGRVRITRSLDSSFGLDQEAVVAVKQWRFRPGEYRGQPVAVAVTIEMAFTVH